MDVIKISDKIYDENPVFSAYESHIFEDDDILIKIFKTDSNETLTNKINKLEMLKDIITDLKIYDLVSINGIIKGYTMENKKGYEPLNCLYDKRNEKIIKLKQIKNKLDFLHQNGIIFGDLHSGNILTNGTEICLCDYDNVKIDKYDFDKKNVNMRQYDRSFADDFNLDYFMLNLLSVAYVQNIEETYIIPHLKDHYLPYVFDTKENRKILESMLYFDRYEKLGLFIENTKKLTLYKK